MRPIETMDVEVEVFAGLRSYLLTTFADADVIGDVEDRLAMARRMMERFAGQAVLISPLYRVGVVGYTAGGREVRCEVAGHVGAHIAARFAVQPRNDNYWATASTPESALRAAGWVD